MMGHSSGTQKSPIKLHITLQSSGFG